MLQLRLSKFTDRRPSCAMRRGASSPGVPLRTIRGGKASTAGNATWPARLDLFCAGSAHGVRTLRRFAPTSGGSMFPSSRTRMPLTASTFPDRFHRTSRRTKAQDKGWRRRASGATWLPGLSFRWSVSGISRKRNLSVAPDRSCLGLFLLQGCRNAPGASPARRQVDHSICFIGPWLT
jgi:hypothetical protein